MSLRHEHIGLDAFNRVLSRYSALIAKVSDRKQKRKTPALDQDETLASLDQWRLEVLPRDLASRREANSKDDCLRKAEVEKLIRWKLKHGTFRPSLMKLVAWNSEDTIRKTTARAFEVLSEAPDKDVEALSNKIMDALGVLTELKGIGPASASALLSVRHPDHVPFFSDEAYRWLTCTTGNAWTVGIKYNVKEFRMMLSTSLELCQRLSVNAVDVERVGWVLGQEGSNLDQEVPYTTSGSKRKQEKREVDDGPADGQPSGPRPIVNAKYSKRVKR